MSNSEERDSFRPLIWAIVAVLVLLFLVGVTVWAILPEWSDRGTFGDMFGAANALFSGMAFAGILFALHLQRRELEIQRLELKAQREELKLTRGELARSAKAQESSLESQAGQVAALRFSAELNALVAVIENLTTKIASTDKDVEKRKLINIRASYVQMIEDRCTALLD